MAKRGVVREHLLGSDRDCMHVLLGPHDLLLERLSFDQRPDSQGDPDGACRLIVGICEEAVWVCLCLCIFILCFYSCGRLDGPVFCSWHVRLCCLLSSRSGWNCCRGEETASSLSTKRLFLMFFHLIIKLFENRL